MLALARDQDKLHNSAQWIDLHTEIPTIIENHRHLCAGKQLSILNELTQPMPIKAPLQLVRVAIGNLIRNAVENSDCGVIRILADHNTLIIDDPGHGMNAQKMSDLYTCIARTGGKGFGGIGIELIIKICQHYGWDLQFDSVPDKGTRVMLTFS